MDRFSIITLILFICLFGYLLYKGVEHSIPNSFLKDKYEELPKELVCMVNDAYMGKEQIPVIVGDKTYYGCCEMCKVKLNKERATRYSEDPLTGVEVDKALAFIVLKPSGGDGIFYFTAKENYIKYLEKNQKN